MSAFAPIVGAKRTSIRSSIYKGGIELETKFTRDRCSQNAPGKPDLAILWRQDADGGVS
jgi:hypothetical protein